MMYNFLSYFAMAEAAEAILLVNIEFMLLNSYRNQGKALAQEKKRYIDVEQMLSVQTTISPAIPSNKEFNSIRIY